MKQKYLFIRYGVIKDFDFNNHIDFFNSNHYFWFCKFGKTPSLQTINLCTYKNIINIILHGPFGTFICKSVLFTNNLDISELPSYYYDINLRYAENKKGFFKITTFQKKDKKILDTFVVVKSNKKLSDVIRLSSNPIMIIN